MRYRVDTKGGYVSFDEREAERAWELFDQEGIRIRQCRDVHDEGTVIAGMPIVEDLTLRSWEMN